MQDATGAGRRLPPLNSLRAFEAAARLGSFAAAAEELHVTQGAVSRHIQQLESWLGRPLFERRHRGVVPTPVGAAYGTELRGAFDLLAAATQRQQEAAAQQVLQVNVPGTFALRWLIPRLSSFQRGHPAIEVRLATSYAPLAALGREVDVAVRGTAEEAAGWQARPFLAERRLPVCAPAVLREAPLARPQDLAQHTLLHAATSAGAWDEWLRLAGAPGLQPRRALTFGHFHLALQAALDGLGVAIGPAALVAHDLEAGRLVQPFDGPSLPPWRYAAYMPQARARSAAATAFVEWLVQAADAGSGGV
ncbi:transcriptional regulator GcvA [Xylophilus sp.]|uniref:transcriptional regulator GcvA n=1 Tax=Xylophilus sp. TaxID=2653893 RepID=UPI0013B5B16A|nr:transcriptional regulator GcvA [Xylophilus sp.]KAF1047754.1 MAG: Glycine cleavage system transcriptional activator [Xylophilus sp.]